VVEVWGEADSVDDENVRPVVAVEVDPVDSQSVDRAHVVGIQRVDTRLVTYERKEGLRLRRTGSCRDRDCDQNDDREPPVMHRCE
jgi:hypothetical protein